MRGLRLAVPVAVAACAASLLGGPAVGEAAERGCATDWAGFQHDAAHTADACGGVSAANVDRLTPGWFHATPGAVTAEPTVGTTMLYVGDGSGVFHALDRSSGREVWSFNVTRNRIHDDRHAVSYSEIASSAAYAAVPGLGPAVFFGGGGTVYAVAARTGRPLWATDLDPRSPASPAEAESSPVLWARPDGHWVVLTGEDVNESEHSAHGGLVALDAVTGQLLWKFDPETRQVVHDPSYGDGNGLGCGDVWSSPALDAARRLVVFGTGNCNSPAADRARGGTGEQTIFALRADTGRPAWDFVEPPNHYGSDDDFGSSAMLARVGSAPVVVEGGKSGFLYALDERSGRLRWKTQAAQPGQSGDFAGAIGGFIGAAALGSAGTAPAVFGDTAIPTPFAGAGPSSSGGDVALDSSLAPQPTRAASLHAVDLRTGRVLWQQPLEAPTYAPVTDSGGVLFAPSTAGFAVNAFDTTTGRPLWSVPVAGAPSSGVAVVGSTIYFGIGTYLAAGQPYPPQQTGVWCFRVAG